MKNSLTLLVIFLKNKDLIITLFNIHIFLNEAKWDNIDPPYQHKVILSEGDHIFTFESFGSSFFTSVMRRSGKVANIVLPPDITISE